MDCRDRPLRTTSGPDHGSWRDRRQPLPELRCPSRRRDWQSSSSPRWAGSPPCLRTHATGPRPWPTWPKSDPGALARHLNSHTAAWRKGLHLTPQPGSRAPEMTQRADVAPGTLVRTPRAARIASDNSGCGPLHVSPTSGETVAGALCSPAAGNRGLCSRQAHNEHRGS